MGHRQMGGDRQYRVGRRLSRAQATGRERQRAILLARFSRRHPLGFVWEITRRMTATRNASLVPEKTAHLRLDTRCCCGWWGNAKSRDPQQMPAEQIGAESVKPERD